MGGIALVNGLREDWSNRLMRISEATWHVPAFTEFRVVDGSRSLNIARC